MNTICQRLFYFFVFSISSSLSAFAQQSQTENPVTIVLKGYKTDYKLLAKNASYIINLNDGIFSFNVPLTKFVSLDTTGTIDAQVFLEDVFEEEFFPALNYSAQIPISKLDKETDNLQKITGSGKFILGDIEKQLPVNLDMKFMDRELMYNFLIILQPSDLILAIPDKYKNILTGTIEIRGDYLILPIKY